MIARKRAGLPPLPLGGKDTVQSNLPTITPSVAQEDVEPLPDTYFTDLTKSKLYFRVVDVQCVSYITHSKKSRYAFIIWQRQ